MKSLHIKHIIQRKEASLDSTFSRQLKHKLLKPNTMHSNKSTVYKLLRALVVTCLILVAFPVYAYVFQPYVDDEPVPTNSLDLIQKISANQNNQTFLIEDFDNIRLLANDNATNVIYTKEVSAYGPAYDVCSNAQLFRYFEGTTEQWTHLTEDNFPLYKIVISDANGQVYDYYVDEFTKTRSINYKGGEYAFESDYAYMEPIKPANYEDASNIREVEAIFGPDATIRQESDEYYEIIYSAGSLPCNSTQELALEYLYSSNAQFEIDLTDLLAVTKVDAQTFQLFETNIYLTSEDEGNLLISTQFEFEKSFVSIDESSEIFTFEPEVPVRIPQTNSVSFEEMEQVRVQALVQDQLPLLIIPGQMVTNLWTSPNSLTVNNYERDFYAPGEFGDLLFDLENNFIVEALGDFNKQYELTFNYTLLDVATGVYIIPEITDFETFIDFHTGLIDLSQIEVEPPKAETLRIDGEEREVNVYTTHITQYLNNGGPEPVADVRTHIFVMFENNGNTYLLSPWDGFESITEEEFVFAPQAPFTVEDVQNLIGEIDYGF